MDGFVEYENVRKLKLTPFEQTSLTKLSLSKMISGLEKKLKDEEKKNQTVIFTY